MSKRLILWIGFFMLLCIPLLGVYYFISEYEEDIRSFHPNVVLITIDTCRADVIGAYGNPIVSTPSINALTRLGVLFVRGYAPIPTTGPSHTTLLTGRNPAAHRVFRNGMRFSGDFPTIAEFFKQNAYSTAAFISGYSLTERSSGLSVGFDLYDDKWSEKQVERSGERTTDAFLSWYKNRGSPNSFFAWIHFFDPHSPYRPTDPYGEMMLDAETLKSLRLQAGNYKPDKVRAYRKNAANARKNHAFGVLVKDPATTRADSRTIQNNYALYEAEVSRVDRCIAKIFRCLEQDRQFDPTLIVITADHGEGFDHSYYFGHGDRLWESATHVPWIIKFPYNKSGPRISNSIVLHEDLVPTLIKAAHLKGCPTDLPGEDLNFNLKTQKTRRQLDFFTAAPPLPRKHLTQGLLVSVYESHYKMIRNMRTGEVEIYDLENDPAEQNKLTDVKIKKWMLKHLLHYAKKAQFPEDSQYQVSDSDVKRKLKKLGYID